MTLLDFLSNQGFLNPAITLERIEIGPGDDFDDPWQATAVTLSRHFADPTAPLTRHFTVIEAKEEDVVIEDGDLKRWPGKIVMVCKGCHGTGRQEIRDTRTLAQVGGTAPDNREVVCDVCNGDKWYDAEPADLEARRQFQKDVAGVPA